MPKISTLHLALLKIAQQVNDVPEHRALQQSSMLVWEREGASRKQVQLQREMAFCLKVEKKAWDC